MVKRAAMYIKLNDLLVGDNHILPVVGRPRVTAVSGNDFTVVRGQAGTTASVHVNGTGVYGTLLSTDTTMYVNSNAGFSSASCPGRRTS